MINTSLQVNFFILKNLIEGILRVWGNRENYMYWELTDSCEIPAKYGPSGHPSL